MTASELKIYNSEIDQVNALYAHVSSELSASGSEDTETSASLWSEVQDTVAPETFSVMTKIATKIQK